MRSVKMTCRVSLLVGLSMLLGFVFAFSAVAGDKLPDIVGAWQGKVEIHRADKGFQENSNHLQFIIKEQKGHAFHGSKEWTDVAGGHYSETFSGVFSADGKRLYIAEHEDGFMTGDVVSQDRIYLYYLEGGDFPKAIFYELNRSQ